MVSTSTGLTHGWKIYLITILSWGTSGYLGFESISSG